MSEFIMQSDEINELATALSLAQGEIEGAIKDSANPFFKSKYADLHAVKEACREPFAKNGLSVVQPTVVENDKICLVTMLMHKSGQWIKGIMPLVFAKQDPQAIGSAMTYFRRYAFCAMVGVSQFDDDGEAAMDRTKKKVENKQDQATVDDLFSKLSAVNPAVVKSAVVDCVRNSAIEFKVSEDEVIYAALSNESHLNRFLAKVLKQGS